MRYNYYPKGVCSRQIMLDIDENDIITDAKFIGGCSGNLQGISKLIIGQKVQDVIPKIKGILCRNNTSCPDQLSIALEQYLQDKNK
ncbi:MAG: TIGR03905 family TSCPD domain-containing protein [Christensenellales bacterium]